MRILKKTGLPIVLLGLLYAGNVFAYTSMASWNSISDGWSCVSRTASGAFPETHYHIVTDSSSPDPSSSLRITYPDGWPDAREPAHCYKGLSTDYEDIYVQYYFKYSPAYQFHGVDNKQTYYWLGSSSSNWYLSVRGSQKISLVTQTYNTARYNSNTGYDPIINPGTWYKITARFKMNSPGVLNGICQVWINDTLVMNHTNIGYRSSTQSGMGMKQATITPVFGGSSGIFKTQTDYQWYDRFIITTDQSELSVQSGGSVIAPEPNPPTIISVN